MRRSERPRSTKNVYFFKSGDQTFPGVRIPVNNRKYRRLDAVLDDLSRRIPLPRGVRTVATPRGVDRITDLSQLRHMGTYVCSDRIQARFVAPVNIAKIKNLTDPQLIHTANIYQEPVKPEPPKRLKKVKKKKRKVKKKKVPVEAASDGQVNVNLQDKPPGVLGLLAEGSLMALMPTTKQADTSRNENEEGDDYPDGSSTWRRSGETTTGDEERPEEADNESVYEDDDEEQQANVDHEDEQSRMTTRADSRKAESGQRSATAESVFDSGKSQNDDKELPPLDGNKLAHVQRRRLASNQVDPDRYTLPSDSSPGSIKENSGNATRPTSKNESRNGNKVDANDDVDSLRVDEILSLRDEPLQATRSSTKNENKPPNRGGADSVEAVRKDVQNIQAENGISLQA